MGASHQRNELQIAHASRPPVGIQQMKCELMFYCNSMYSFLTPMLKCIIYTPMSPNRHPNAAGALEFFWYSKKVVYVDYRLRKIFGCFLWQVVSDAP